MPGRLWSCRGHPPAGIGLATDLVAADHPFLFASVAGTLSSFGMKCSKPRHLPIAAAWCSTRSRLTIPCARSIESRGKPAACAPPPSVCWRARRTFASCWATGPSPHCPAARRAFPATVSFDSEASHTATLVEIVAQDRPGLLYDLASTISSNGGNIEVVLIDTQAHKAIDVFYVTAEGKKLGPEKRRLLADALRKPASQGSAGATLSP